MADFGEDFVRVKKFQTIKNQRRVHANAIYREVQLCRENKAIEKSKGELEMRLANLHKNYDGFLAEHKQLLTMIPPKDYAQLKEQEKYQVQVENDYLTTAGEYHTFINDKDYLIRAAEVEQMNRVRFASPKNERSRFEPRAEPPNIEQLRQETSKIAEKAVVDARKELAEIRAKKHAVEFNVPNNEPNNEPINEPQAGSSGLKIQKAPLQQLMDQYRICGLNSDTDDETKPMSDGEIEEELNRYSKEKVENSAEFPMVQSPKMEEYVPTPLTKEQKGRAGAESMCRQDNSLRSTVGVVNPVEHNDLRNRLKMRHEPIPGRSSERSLPYQSTPPPKTKKTKREISCFNCNGRHAMFKCQLFNEMQLTERIQRVQHLGLCENCFCPMLNEYGHQHICKSGMCRRCWKGYHNSTLCNE